MMRKTNNLLQYGITLVELLVTMAIFAVLVGVATPSFQGAVAANALRSATTDLMTGIALTRSIALQTGGRASMCPSLSGTQCDATAEWENGWIIFSGPSGLVDEMAKADSEVVVDFHGALPSGIVVRSNDGVPGYISYGADGAGKILNGAYMAGTIRVCSTSAALEDADRARNLVMNATGRISNRQKTTDTSCLAPVTPQRSGQ